MFQSINPANEEILLTTSFQSDEEIKDLILKSKEGYKLNKALSLNERGSIIRSIGENLLEQKERYAKWISTEMGKPIEQALFEIEKCKITCDHYANEASKYLDTKSYISEYKNAELRFEPLGVILGIMPWNFPFWQVFRFVIPTLLAGNSVLIKHAPNSGICASLLNNLFTNNQLPNGSYLNLIASNEQIEEVISKREIKGVSLTGSSMAGSKVAQIAGNHLKPVVLELGGSDAFVVCEDVSLDHVVQASIMARLQNNGQSCIAAKRFFIPEKIMDEFKQKLIHVLSSEVVIGNPKKIETTIGPLARKDLLEDYYRQIRQGENQGAQLVFKAKHKQSKGFYAEVLVYEIDSTCNILAQEEIFGPCFVLIPYTTKENCLEMVNDSIYGLSSNVWTDDSDLKKYYSENIESGAVFINSISGSDARFPFGGIKKSGIGKELGELGIKSFVNQKLVIEA